jgi:hypothetical protein
MKRRVYSPCRQEYGQPVEAVFARRYQEAQEYYGPPRKVGAVYETFIGAVGMLLVAVAVIAGTAAMPVANAAGVSGSGNRDASRAKKKNAA